MCVGERARVSLSVYLCACVPGVCECTYVYVYVCVYIYICRENVSTVAVFRHFPATDIYVSEGFYEDLSPAWRFRLGPPAVFGDQR